MGFASLWEQPGEVEALWRAASPNVPLCLILGGIIGILVDNEALLLGFVASFSNRQKTTYIEV